LDTLHLGFCVLFQGISTDITLLDVHFLRVAELRLVAVIPVGYGVVQIAEFQISKYFAAYNIDCREWIIFQVTSLISAE
jgi:hypothetical protein